MKKLTMNRLSLAGIRANRKDMTVLILSVFLAVFFTVGTLLGLDALYQRRRVELAAQYGTEDAIFFATTLTPEDLTSRSLAKRAGTVTLVGTADGFPVGYYDDTAQALLARQCLQGALPCRTGEVALDRRVKERLFPDAQIGERIVLSIKSPKSGTQNVEFRLVGILRGQHEDDTQDMLSGLLPKDALNFPQILLYSAENLPPVTRHIVVTFSRGINLEALESVYPEEILLGVQPSGGLYKGKPMFNTFEILKDTINMGSSLMLAGVCLLFGSMVGIFSAVSGQFQRKEAQYRLLRTIGATKGQIRTLSSRDALLLTLLTAPAGCLCAYVFVELLRILFPESLPQQPRPLWALAGLILSTALVWIAARLPAVLSGLHRETLPKGRKLRSHKAYALPKLWNQRSLRFHPLRSTALVFLIVLLNLSAVLSVGYTVAYRRDLPSIAHLDVPDLELTSVRYSSAETNLFTVEPAYHLSPECIRDLQSMPGVESATGVWYGDVLALTDHVGTYFPRIGLTNGHLAQYCEEQLTDRELDRLEASSSVRRMKKIVQALQDYLETDRIPYRLQLLVVPDLAELGDVLVSGRIDTDAINAGTAVLADLPTIYQVDRNGYLTLSRRPVTNALGVIENDQIALGETLSLLQLHLDAAQAQKYDLTTDDPDTLPFSEATVQSASPKVCGFVNTDIASLWPGAIITTPEGIRNMGLSYVQLRTLTVSLSSSVTRQEKQAILDKLETLSYQEDGLVLSNNTDIVEAFSASRLRHILFRCAITVMLLLLVLLEIRGNLYWLIRSEQRNFGILRAIGAENATLEALCHRQTVFCTLCALLLSMGIYGLGTVPRASFAALYSLFFNCAPLYSLAAMAVCTALVLLLSLHAARRALKRLEAQSIIETIREE